MQRTIGNENRFRILTSLVDKGTQSATELQEALAVESNTLHSNLDAFVDLGLVENRKRIKLTSNDHYSYYRAIALGERILEQGLRELMREEWRLLDAYSS